MENKILIKYKWEQGVYNLKDLLKLVQKNQITISDFFEISRYDYAAAAQKYKNQI